MHYQFHSRSCTNPLTTSKHTPSNYTKPHSNDAGRATTNKQLPDHKDLIGPNSTRHSIQVLEAVSTLQTNVV